MSVFGLKHWLEYRAFVFTMGQVLSSTAMGLLYGSGGCGDPAEAQIGSAGMESMRVVVVPVLSDNYAYLLIDDATKQAAAVDPAEAHLVLAAAQQAGVEIVAVLTTHKHSMLLLSHPHLGVL